jgi:hypothetical protein
MKKYRAVWTVVFAAAAVLPAVGATGGATIDSAGVSIRKDPVSSGRPASDEILLDDIDIQGEAEKPSVIILPKRVEPDVPRSEPERSFGEEVRKAAIGDADHADRAIGVLEPVKSIKKTVEKNRQ